MVEGATSASFSVGTVLSRSFDILGKNPLVFLLLATVAVLPFELSERVIIARLEVANEEDFWALLRSAIATNLVAQLINLVATAMLTYAAFQTMRGKPGGIGAAISKGLSRIAPVVGLAILQSLGILAGVLLLVIPAFILATMWFVAIPCCVVENRGPIDSLYRSSELTKGYKWQVFGLLISVYLIAFLVGIVMAIVIGLLNSVFQLTTLSLLIELAFIVLVTAVYAIVVVVTYQELRTVKEGVDLDEIAAVFD